MSRKPGHAGGSSKPFKRVKPTKPVPATVILRLMNRRDSGEKFISLSATLYQNGLIFGEPRELRRSLARPDQLELICTFVDPVAARTWLRNTAVRKQFGKLFEERLDGKPKVVRCRDVILDVDRERVCRCTRPSAFILEGHAIRSGGPLVCRDCANPWPNYKIPGTYDMQGWASLYKNVWDIWLDSGPLEGWALKQLNELGSEVNAAGRDLARKLSRMLGVPVYYRTHREDVYGIAAKCPGCRSTGSELPRSRSFRLCTRCRLVF